MITEVHVVESLPTARPAGRPCDPPDELIALREQTPLARLRYPDGHLGWLATGYHEVRAVLADRRFSSRYELMHFPLPLPGGLTELPPAPPGDLTGIDPPAHTRLRQLLVGYFTVRRMRALHEGVVRVADELLAELDATSGPVDLVEAYARLLPARVICELLGVPYTDRDFFQSRTLTITDLSVDGERKLAALDEIQAYLRELVGEKRARPGEDVLSALTASDLTDDELAAVGGFVLSAAFDTTANMIALGTFALLEHPDQLALLRADPEALAGPAVEELLRWLTIAHLNVRGALSDVEVGGVTIAAGQSVTLAVQAADRDPRRFPDGDRLDLRRVTTGHMAFGHGLHQCLAQQLARVELQVALPALVTRFPDLRLAVDVRELPFRADSALHGVERLPVTW